MNRQQRRHGKSSGTSLLQQQFNQELRKNLAIHDHAMINALVLAMNSELGVGKERADRVITAMNSLVENNTPEQLEQMASRFYV